MTLSRIVRCRRASSHNGSATSDRVGSSRATAVLVLASLLGLVVLGRPAGSIAGQGAVGLGEEREALQARSDVKSLAIVLAHDLPKAPPTASDRDSCEHLTIAPSRSVGRIVAGKGWAVTGEVSLPAGNQAVSFAGKFEQGTSGSCFVSEGNVAIFHGETLLAIVYAPRASKETIGKILPLADGHARIWGGDFLSQPIADLRVENGGYLLALAPLAAEETVCGGKAVMPNIYGMAIDRARKVLESKGWTPVRGAIGKSRVEQGREIDLVERGILEVESCSGTGFGFCSFSYRGSAGTLSVTTVGDGEFPSVSGYGATCR